MTPSFQASAIWSLEVAFTKMEAKGGADFGKDPGLELEHDVFIIPGRRDPS